MARRKKAKHLGPATPRVQSMFDAGREFGGKRVNKAELRTAYTKAQRYYRMLGEAVRKAGA